MIAWRSESAYVPVYLLQLPFRPDPVITTREQSCGVGAGAGVGAPVGVGAGVIWTLVLLLLTTSPPLAIFRRHTPELRWLKRPAAHFWHAEDAYAPWNLPRGQPKQIDRPACGW